MKEKPIISVCIPVYNSEQTLKRCLDSVFAQDFDLFEIVLVNDGSTGRDEDGLNCKKIVKSAQKAGKILRKKSGLSAVNFVYYEHGSNLGLLEARRTAVQYAGGEYICILDSDDVLLPDALKNLYEAAKSTNADIVQGKTEVSCYNSTLDSETEQKLKQVVLERYNNVYIGELSGREVFDGFLVQQNHIGLLWAKLIRREVYLDALSLLPFTNLVMSEDFPQYFFISHKASKYVGIDKAVYCYSIDTGISGNSQITDLARWERICTNAIAFLIVFGAIKELPENTFTNDEMEALRLQSRSYLADNLITLQKKVTEKLKPQAREMLCEYWGKDFVETMETAIKTDTVEK